MTSPLSSSETLAMKPPKSKPVSIPKPLTKKKLMDISAKGSEKYFIFSDISDDILGILDQEKNISVLDEGQAEILAKSIEEVGIQEPLRLVYNLNESSPSIILVRGKHRLRAIDIIIDSKKKSIAATYEDELKAYNKAVAMEKEREKKARESGKTFIKRICEEPTKRISSCKRWIKIPVIIEIIRKGESRLREDVVSDISSNSMRRNISLIEKCRGVKILKEEQRMTYKQIADSIGYSSAKTAERIYSAALFLDDEENIKFYEKNKKKLPSTLIFSSTSTLPRLATRARELDAERKTAREKIEQAMTGKSTDKAIDKDDKRAYKITDSWLEDTIGNSIKNDKTLSRHSSKILKILREGLESLS